MKNFVRCEKNSNISPTRNFEVDSVLRRTFICADRLREIEKDFGGRDTRVESLISLDVRYVRVQALKLHLCKYMYIAVQIDTVLYTSFIAFHEYPGCVLGLAFWRVYPTEIASA